jgi:hypothetical protein
LTISKSFEEQIQFPWGNTIMIQKTLLLSCSLVLSLSAFQSAKADTIGPGSCGSCLGSSYTLTYSTTANPSAFDVFLTVNTTGFTNSNTDLLNAVSLKLDSSTPTATLISAPATFATTIAGGLSANGCDGSGSGFFCSQSTGTGLQVGHPGDTYTWEWLVTAGSSGDLLAGIDAASLKALYVDPTGKQNGITSERISLTNVPPAAHTPEPSSLLLLGTGLAGLAGVFRRKVFPAA